MNALKLRQFVELKNVSTQKEVTVVRRDVFVVLYVMKTAFVKV